MDNAQRNAGRGGETGRLLGLVWLLLILDALAIILTYRRFPPEEFYHFSQAGFSGALGRALVFSNFPVAPIAMATIGVAVLALRGSPHMASPRDRRIVTAVAIVGTALCLVTAFPGVVDAGDLDAKPVNVVPLAGVLIAIGLSLLAVRRGAWPPATTRTWREPASVAIVAVLAIVALPWIVAELGYYIDDIPLIGRLFIASEVPPGETLAAVHIGHHHGLDGLLFVASALALSYLTRNRFTGALETALSVYLALMFTYGAFNLANDGWLEQIVKRGWVKWEIPGVLTPGLTVAWGLIIVGAAILWFVVFRSDATEPAPAEAAPSRAMRVNVE
jgi:hypothetical protein